MSRKKNPKFASQGLNRHPGSVAVRFGWSGSRYGCGDRMPRDKAFIPRTSRELPFFFTGLEFPRFRELSVLSHVINGSSG